MYDELIKRLRSATTLPAMNALCQEAANAIEELNGKMRLYSFIWTHLPKGELDMLLYMYHEQEEA